jgi:hypothetical protein
MTLKIIGCLNRQPLCEVHQRLTFLDVNDSKGVRQMDDWNWMLTEELPTDKETEDGDV